ncbi:COX assembly mitochondrial protein homolog isoform X1 [Ctenopharyngodon idella]|uniref:COX assembly mitochondrial protein homolog isoform X1 n=1 Tax=Ctenopharyngodon idella TaxID=7959 RepID=UPI00222F0E12|nr:COX assembly mitochondrial protein homolog isoform X1 [Ctenopharyngodon idella]
MEYQAHLCSIESIDLQYLSLWVLREKQTQTQDFLLSFSVFNRCCKDAGFFMVFKCREENAALKECLTRHYQDPAFFEECKQEYLKEKQEFQQTGIPGKNRKQKLPTSM